LQKEEKGLSV